MTPESPSPPSTEPPADNHRVKIHNWPDTTDESKVIRYMKLSTFLLLLNNRVFIPSIRRLQEDDSFEAKIPRLCCEPLHYQYENMMWNHVFGKIEQENWLFKSAGVEPVLRKSTSPHEPMTLWKLTDIWLTQLARRRCVWCWDRSTEQLHAMWKLYGQRGVAVSSTVGKIRKALELRGVRQGIVSPVRYVRLPSFQKPEDVSAEFGLLDPANLPRPYLFKDSGFRIEEEIRFVLAANPIATDVFGGAIFNIAAQLIICDFDVSREIPDEERRCIKLLAKERLNAPTKPRSPDYEAAFPDEAIFPHLEPFLPEPDLPPGIFPDLGG